MRLLLLLFVCFCDRNRLRTCAVIIVSSRVVVHTLDILQKSKAFGDCTEVCLSLDGVVIICMCARCM